MREEEEEEGRSEEGHDWRTAEAMEQPIAASASSPVGAPARMWFVRDVRRRMYGNPSIPRLRVSPRLSESLHTGARLEQNTTQTAEARRAPFAVRACARMCARGRPITTRVRPCMHATVLSLARSRSAAMGCAEVTARENHGSYW